MFCAIIMAKEGSVLELKDKLKQLRKEKGLSQAQLAELLFVSRSTVAKWENGLGLPGPESMERLEQEFEITKEEIATSEPETVIVEKNRRLRRFSEATFIVGTLVLLVLLPTILVMGYEFGYGITPEMAAGEYTKDGEYFDMGDYRIYYFGWPQIDENGQETPDYFVMQGIMPIKKHFWGCTQAGNQAYKVFDGDKCVAVLHTVKGKNGYYNFLKFYYMDDWYYAEYLLGLDQVYVNGHDSSLTDELDLFGGEECEVQKGFFFVSSKRVERLYIGEQYLYVDTMFVSDSLV